MLQRCVRQHLKGSSNTGSGRLVVDAFDAVQRRRLREYDKIDAMQRNADVEQSYIHFLRIMSLVLDKPFRGTIDRLLGSVLVGGHVARADIKGYARMIGKLQAPEDHGLKEIPRPQFNVDCVRCLATFDTPEAIKSALTKLEAEFGGFAKFKNGMRWSAEEAKERFHLCTIIATVPFAHPVHLTFGQLRSDPNVQNIMQSYLQTQKVPESIVARGTWKKNVDQALDWIFSIPANTPFSMLCEVQCVLRMYRDTRVRMHEGYRIVRAVDPESMAIDYAKFKVAAMEKRELEQDGGGPFILACRDGSIAAVTRLVEEQSHSNICRGFALTCKYVRPQCARILLPFIKDVNELMLDGKSPLAWTCEGTSIRWQFSVDDDRVQIAWWLLACKASLTAKSSSNHPLAVATRAGRTEIVKVLLQCRADVEAHEIDVPPLYCAAKYGHAGLVALLLRSKANPCRAGTGGETPLCIAAEYGYIEICRLLLAAKGDPRTPDDHGCTPVQMAACRGKTACLLLLLNQPHVEVNTQDHDGDTPLLGAAQDNRFDCIKYLLEANADPTIANHDGLLPLDTSLTHGSGGQQNTQCAALLRQGLQRWKGNNTRQ